MIHSPKFKVVLDACVLYPAPVRDILLSLAAEGLFKPKWSEAIQDEWIRNLLKNRTDLSIKVLNQTKCAMNFAFPDANVEKHEGLISLISLPDKNDRHVLACGIKSNSDLILTFNIRDFPKAELSKFDIEVQHPDDFILNLFELNEKITCNGFTKMTKRIKNPPLTKHQILEMLKKCGLPKSASVFLECTK